MEELGCLSDEKVPSSDLDSEDGWTADGTSFARMLGLGDEDES